MCVLCAAACICDCRLPPFSQCPWFPFPLSLSLYRTVFENYFSVFDFSLWNTHFMYNTCVCFSVLVAVFRCRCRCLRRCLNFFIFSFYFYRCFFIIFYFFLALHSLNAIFRIARFLAYAIGQWPPPAPSLSASPTFYSQLFIVCKVFHFGYRAFLFYFFPVFMFVFFFLVGCCCFLAFNTVECLAQMFGRNR